MLSKSGALLIVPFAGPIQPIALHRRIQLRRRPSNVRKHAHQKSLRARDGARCCTKKPFTRAHAARPGVDNGDGAPVSLFVSWSFIYEFGRQRWIIWDIKRGSESLLKIE